MTAAPRAPATWISHSVRCSHAERTPLPFQPRPADPEDFCENASTAATTSGDGSHHPTVTALPRATRLPRERIEPARLTRSLCCCQIRHGGEGTLREHQRGRRRAHAVNRSKGFPSYLRRFRARRSPTCPRFPLQTSMARRGSTVRVRQRALRSSCKPSLFRAPPPRPVAASLST